MRELLARRQKGIAISEGPAVVLNVCELHTAGAGRFGESEHFRELIDVAAVNDEVQSDRHAMALEPFEDAEFLGMSFRAGDFLRDFFAGALEAQLKVIEAGLHERI